MSERLIYAYPSPACELSAGDDVIMIDRGNLRAGIVERVEDCTAWVKVLGQARQAYIAHAARPAVHGRAVAHARARYAPRIVLVEGRCLRCGGLPAEPRSVRLGYGPGASEVWEACSALAHADIVRTAWAGDAWTRRLRGVHTRS